MTEPLPSSAGAIAPPERRPGRAQGNWRRWMAMFCRRACRAWIAALALACPVGAWAQAPAAFAPTKVNAARLRWLDYKMVAGRVVATSAYPAGMNISFGPSVIGGRLREHLQLVILENQASVQYELGGDGQSLAITLAQDGEFSIRRARQKPKFAMKLVQPPAGPLSLAIEEGGAAQSLDGASFWHLFLERPDLVRAHVLPQLELLRPNWQLAATGFAIEEALFERARNPRAFDTGHWSRLIDTLASGDFAERQRAQRELLEIGQVLLPFLEGLDRERLDAEQASRVGMLVAALSVDYEDTPDRVAAWLAADRRVWLSLLGRDQQPKREAAAEHLARLLGRPIEFDPAGDAATRQTQLDKLRAWLAAEPVSVPPPGAEP